MQSIILWIERESILNILNMVTDYLFQCLEY